MAESTCQFEIHPSAGVPIYRQIVDQVYALVAGGKLRPGDALPSVRQVAKASDVNPMTVSKAYAQLEADGVVERVRGQAMRIAAFSTNGTLSQRRAQLRALLAPALHRASQLGLSADDVRTAVDKLIQEYLP